MRDRGKRDALGEIAKLLLQRIRTCAMSQQLRLGERIILDLRVG
ncbi:MAG TPA: hypothetical protein VGJ82_16720 [Thermoanaerobaculia bacterium]